MPSGIMASFPPRQATHISYKSTLLRAGFVCRIFPTLWRCLHSERNNLPIFLRADLKGWHDNRPLPSHTWGCDSL